MNISVAGIAKKGLPEGFAYADELVPDCIVDAKYAGTDNFMGAPVDGYRAPLVVVSRALGVGLIRAADLLRQKGYLLKLFDGYRPQRAVDCFARWAADAADVRRKPVHYPNVPEKRMLFELGYIAAKSGHTRGRSIDLTLVDAATHQELDMGSAFDYMDARSHHGAAGLTSPQEANRLVLREAMLACGFTPYEDEWWHYNIAPEPFPDTYFDFPVE
ncbi:MAG TPA: M15 family metallopeptidase [Clostridia bacterium]|nr:M15 family metallopeptidase [Clostridia bacterium]